MEGLAARRFHAKWKVHGHNMRPPKHQDLLFASPNALVYALCITYEAP